MTKKDLMKRVDILRHTSFRKFKALKGNDNSIVREIAYRHQGFGEAFDAVYEALRGDNVLLDSFDLYWHYNAELAR